MKAKKYLLAIPMVLLSLVASADTVEIDGVYYELVAKAKIAVVTGIPNDFVGEAVIHETVEYDDVTYSVTSIREMAFYNREKMTSVSIPSSVTKIGYNAFYGCKNLSAVYITDLATWCGMLFEDDGYYTRSWANPLYIAHRLFLNGKEVLGLEIPDGVESIAEDAFVNCSSLTSLTIPESVKAIGRKSFSGCSNLVTVNLGNGVETMGEYAFSGCGSLTDITFGSGLTAIANLTFDGCSSLTALDIPGNVKRIKGGAFKGCSSVSSLSLGNGVETIETGAFQGCASLASVTIPASVKSVGYDAFLGCTSLTSVNISDLTAWCEVDFPTGYSNPICNSHRLLLNGEDVKELVIPDNATKIGNRAFTELSTITSVTIPGSVTGIGDNAFSYCNSLSSVVIAAGVAKIGDYAFTCCNSLTTVKIPDTVNSIGEAAFYECNLSSVAIGTGVNSISRLAFAKNPELADVYCLAGKVPETDGNAFHDCYIEYATLHVPARSVDAYKTTVPWSSFKEIVAIDDDGQGIEGIQYDESGAADAAYDLQGRRLKAVPAKGGVAGGNVRAPKGLYIRGGKKYVR